MSFFQYMSGRPGPSGFGSSSTAAEVAAKLGATGLGDKVAVITGATSGIGVETARVVAQYAKTVVLACRNEAASLALIAKIKAETPAADVRFIQLDLSSFASVRAFVAAFNATGLALDVLINNAGVVSRDNPVPSTKEGWELMFGTNHLGHFLLTTLLLERPAPPRRIVFVSSEAHRFTKAIDYNNLRGGGRAPLNFMAVYGRSKLANLLTVVELQRRYADRGITCVAIHPGAIKTNLGGGGAAAAVIFFLFGAFAKSVAQGAATTLYAACAPDSAQIGGKYLADCNVAPVADVGKDAEAAKQLWDFSVKAVAAADAAASAPPASS